MSKWSQGGCQFEQHIRSNAISLDHGRFWKLESRKIFRPLILYKAIPQAWRDQKTEIALLLYAKFQGLINTTIQTALYPPLDPPPCTVSTTFFDQSLKR